MTAHPRAQDDERAVSTVLGAILMFGLLITTLVMIQVRYVPVWDKQREADANLGIVAQLGQIKSDLDRLSANQTAVGISDPLSLARAQGFQFFQSPLLPGTATFTPVSTGAGMAVTTVHQIAIQSNNGAPLYGLGEDYTVWNGAQITGILSLEHLRIRIPSPNGLPTGTQTFDLTFTDVNNNCEAEVKLVATGTTLTTKNIEAQVYGPQATAAATCSTTAIYVRDDYIGLSNPQYYFFDAFASETQFTGVLGAIPTGLFPLKAQYAPGNTGGAASMVYDQATTYGVIRTGGAGQTFATYNLVIPSSQLTVAINNQRLPSQSYTLEYGAVFLDQADGSVMIDPPAFAVSTTATQGAIRWAFPAMSGGSSAVSGARTAEVVMTPGGNQAAITAAAQDITFTITTRHPAAWHAFFDQRMALAGLSPNPIAQQAPCSGAASPQYSVTEGATSVALTFYGPCAASTDSTKDVALIFQETGIGLELRATS